MQGEQMNPKIKSKALLPQFILTQGDRVCLQVFAVLGGILLLALLAQVAIPLPFTPVPITGQTFGVALISLLWGRKLGVTTVAAYLLFGAFGCPVFAAAKTGALLGPTSGYLLGMFFASYWMGFLADRGATKRLVTTWLSAVSGSVIVFSFGVYGLSFFVPQDQLLTAGVLPFLPGDFIKTLLVTAMAYQATRKLG